MNESKSLIESFSIIRDPRVNRQKKHNLIDVIIVAICGVISGCDGWVDVEEYGNTKYDWFKTFLELPNGIPSHDTFGRIFSIIDPIKFQEAFYDWIQSFVQLKEGEVIALDGKYIKASYREPGRARSIIGMVSAWASEAGVVLAQKRASFDKKNTEKVVYSELIDLLKINGCIITMDAYGCHAKLTNQIVSKDADFIVGLKDNQRALKTSIKREFEKIEGMNVFETKNSGHGRKEIRTCSSFALDDTFLTRLNAKCRKRSQVPWNGLKTAIKIVSQRAIGDKKSVEERFYISSYPADSEKLLSSIRSHWHVENKLHWTLDVAFNEDRCRVTKGYAPENFAVLRQLSLNLLKKEKTSKRSIKGKRLKSAWDNNYLLAVISGMERPNVKD
ncbi:MAG: ISAs1 family transposase [Candidatus Brocadiales bacterium]|nr:ISAs1 family transposase [Candidatus Brocadiales bacterium]